MNLGFSHRDSIEILQSKLFNRDSGYRTSRSSDQTSSFQRLLPDTIEERSQPVERRMVSTCSGNFTPDSSRMDNCYDVSGDNHCFACTVINYEKPFSDRQSAKNDHINLENSMENRGYLFTPITGYVTLEEFKNELLTKLSRLNASTTSFVLSLSCHGDENKLLFSDGKG